MDRVAVAALLIPAVFLVALVASKNGNDRTDLEIVPPVPAPRNDGLQGRASVIDGDTIDVHGIRIRLHGIDAPESRQTCELQERSYPCGRDAAFALANLIGQRPVACEVLDIDRYGRSVSRCFVEDTDINGWMVRNGWAVAYREYSQDYVKDEAAASKDRLGMWRGRFELPKDFRRK